MRKPSPKHQKYYSRHTIRSRTGGRHLKKTEYADWKQKKIPDRPPKIKDKTLLEFMEVKTKEGQHIVSENIARDLKNEFIVDYSLSGIRNAMHRLNHTYKTMEPLHSNMQSVEDVLEWQQDMKKWFSHLKKAKSMFGSTTPLHSNTISPAGSACGYRRSSAYLAVILGTA